MANSGEGLAVELQLSPAVPQKKERRVGDAPLGNGEEGSSPIGDEQGQFVLGALKTVHHHLRSDPDPRPCGIFSARSLNGAALPGTRSAILTLKIRNYQRRDRIMSILAWIIVGIIAGWLAERITGRNHGLLTNLLVGIVGAFLGGFIFSSLLGFRYEEGFNLPSIVVATAGAVVLLAVTGGFRQRTLS
jgi:uncharacterized membrane protein YeaQ/YmgE (transglycosylase-associated protein family)